MLKRLEVEVEVGNGREGCRRGGGQVPGVTTRCWPGRPLLRVLACPRPDPQLTNWHMGGWPHSGDQANTALLETLAFF